MHRTRIKICGVTLAEDAALAVQAGADAIGVIFASSHRQVSRAQAAIALALVPPPVARIGVFVDPTLAEVEAAVAACGLTAVQLSGAETPEFCSAVSVPVIKAVHVGGGRGREAAEPYCGSVAALLFDTYVPGMSGGTSTAFDWRSVELPSWAPVFVAGGLKPDNVAECVSALRPFAVDVASGVEVSPGIKDPHKINAFCAAVRDADREE